MLYLGLYHEAEADVTSQAVGPAVAWLFVAQSVSDARRFGLSTAVLGAAVCTNVESSGDYEPPVSRRHLQL